MFFLFLSCSESLILNGGQGGQAVGRSLSEAGRGASGPAQAVSVGRDLSPNERKLKFYEIVRGILNKAKDRKLAIKSIKLGSNLSSVFGNKNIKEDLHRLVNNGKIDLEIVKLRERIRQDKRRELSAQRWLIRSSEGQEAAADTEEPAKATPS